MGDAPPPPNPLDLLLNIILKILKLILLLVFCFSSVQEKNRFKKRQLKLPSRVGLKGLRKTLV